jgi:hypothetical protein
VNSRTNKILNQLPNVRLLYDRLLLGTIRIPMYTAAPKRAAFRRKLVDNKSCNRTLLSPKSDGQAAGPPRCPSVLIKRARLKTTNPS